MAKGKQTCKILKEIRRQIAETNDIEFITSECRHQGDCAGTCPKCEAEVRYLEQQLERKRSTGKAITVLGISAGLIAMSPITSCTHSASKRTDADKEVQKDTIVASIDSIPPLPPVPVMVGIIEVETTEKPYAPDALNDATQEYDALEVVPVMPEFPGGTQALMQFIAKAINYPTIAQGEVGAQGRVIIRFIIDREGNVVHPVVVRSADPYLDKEAIRVVNEMPKWKPGELEDGTKVAVYYTVPIMFRLQ